MATPLYTTEILRLATETVNWPRLDAADVTVERRAPVCGSSLLLDVALDRTGRIEAVGMRPQSCAMGQASATLFARNATGKNRDEIGSILSAMKAWLSKESDVPPDWPDVAVTAPARDYPARHGAILLPFEAAKAAFDEIQGDHIQGEGKST